MKSELLAAVAKWGIPTKATYVQGDYSFMQLPDTNFLKL